MNAPFPAPPGQAIAWALPTQSLASGKIYEYGGVIQSGYGECGVDSDGNQYGYAEMWHSCGLCDWSAFAQWYNFAAPSLPLNAGGIHGMYIVAEALTKNLQSLFAAWFDMAGAAFVMSPGVVSPGGSAFNGPPANNGANDLFTTVWSGSVGTSLSILPTCSMYGRFFATLSQGLSDVDPPTIYYQNPRIAIYYDAPAMPIGHAANCNAYDPISVAEGSTTPPGNGILIDI